VAPLRPGDPSLQQALGELYIEAGRQADAVPYLAIALQHDQINVELRCRYVVALAAAGRGDEARAQLAVAQGIAPAAGCVQQLRLRLERRPAR
jgi:predicted Zn-dependent protease